VVNKFKIIAARVLASISILTPACKTDFKPMDLNAQGKFDANFFMENPNWEFMISNGAVPDPKNLCPIDHSTAEYWTNSPTCTSQPVYLNQATGWNYGWCKLGGAISGHINWWPVTYDGTIYWSDHSGSDDDYNFNMCRNDQALYTVESNNKVRLEFDSDETVDHWDNTGTWWENFHHSVDDNGDNGNIIVDKSYAIAIGLIGLDGGHTDFSPEIHPVFGLFIHTYDSPTYDTWSFFIRNWGDEGYCSSNEETLLLSNIRVVLPHQNTTGFTLSPQTNVWQKSNIPAMNMAINPCDQGAVATFTFDDPGKKGWFMGDLIIVWQGSNLSKRGDFNQNPINAPFSPDEVGDDGDPATNSKFAKLDSNSKKELAQLLDGSIQLKGYPNMMTERSYIKVRPVVKNERLELPNKGKIPDYSKLIKSVPMDTLTLARKKEKRELIERYLLSSPKKPIKN
jgi:hypothetical protein